MTQNEGRILCSGICYAVWITTNELSTSAVVPGCLVFVVLRKCCCSSSTPPTKTLRVLPAVLVHTRLQDLVVYKTACCLLLQPPAGVSIFTHTTYGVLIIHIMPYRRAGQGNNYPRLLPSLGVLTTHYRRYLAQETPPDTLQ